MVLPIGYDIESDFVTLRIDDDTITFDEDEAGGSAEVGLAVKISAADTVALVEDANPIYGELISVEGDGACLVKKGGFVTLPAGTSHGISAGTRGIVGCLLASAKGYVRASNSAVAAELENARGVCVNAADTTALKIDLG
jgi:hypothetical protein